VPVKSKVNKGDKYNKLTIIKEVERRYNKRCFLCECVCGNKTLVVLSNLRSGHTKSCGCFIKEFNRETKTKHGYAGRKFKARIYEIWTSMKKRCLNKKAFAYKYYGGREVGICDEWLSFKPFLNWAMHNGYQNDLTLERKNCNGDYCPENCTWIPLSEQNNNTRANRFLTFNNKTLTLRDWAKKTNLNYQTLHTRLRNGWSVEKSLITPVIMKYKRAKIYDRN